MLARRAHAGWHGGHSLPHSAPHERELGLLSLEDQACRLALATCWSQVGRIDSLTPFKFAGGVQSSCTESINRVRRLEPMSRLCGRSSTAWDARLGHHHRSRLGYGPS